MAASLVSVTTWECQNVNAMTQAAKKGMKRQETQPERIYSVSAAPESGTAGRTLSPAQVEEAKALIRDIFSAAR